MTSGDGQGRVPFVRPLRRALPVIIVLAVLTAIAEHYGLFDPLETTALDAFIASHRTTPAKEVVLVAIDDNDYDELFHGRSPLDGSTIRRIVEAVLAGGPAVVGVDLDTSHSDFGTALGDFADSRVVWGRDARVTWRGSDVFADPQPVLGQRDPSVPSGLTVFPPSRDGVVRRYARRIGSERFGRVDTLPWALTTRYCSMAGDALPRRCEALKAAPTDEDVILNLAGDRYNFTTTWAAGALLRASMNPSWSDQAAQLFGRKIVLVGGTYSVARDSYPTVVGPMAGVELMGQAVQTDLTGEPQDVRRVVMVVTELLAAIFLVWVNWRLPPGTVLNLVLNGTAVAVLVLGGSYLLFRTTAYWADFVPICAGVVVHQLYDRARENREVRADLAACRARLHATEHARGSD
jgi:CHASE2 domain-containing sensor protein